MTHVSSSPGDMDKSTPSTTESELLQTILDPEQSSPWVAVEIAAEYEQKLSAAGALLEISDAEAAQGWESLSAQLDSVWSGVENSLLVRLQQKFAQRLPADLLAIIAEKAQQMASSGQPMMKQMIGCVQDCLSDVAEADLRVVARPMALAMRGSSADEFVEATILSVRQANWADLSAIEQAKLSLAAARYAISELDS
ncbi:hypothetical protein [Synechococcus sp. PCC 7335]|uniref:hypothetical protein n=1 Tax=Synechococcus sp. (strain ATCC 29403 / PCC 7335) TaxID=91464 RepID=UPI00068346D1|nr:hypothetical protein [Synechococcus sp. PCC 7335]